MFRLRLSQKVEDFRAEFLGWLKDNPPPKASHDGSLQSFVSEGRAWQRQMSSGRWLGVHWPSEYGGRGLSLVEEAVVQEELVRVQAPQVLGLFGITMVGPVLIEHGTPEQKSRYLAKILSGEEIWCQGFSEPGAGSDLAAIKTRADAIPGGFAITGQKVWTSFAHVADHCFILCRTSNEGVKHKGLTYLLVDMKSPGITVRPLRQISGDSEFNEVFFDKVEVPASAVVGRPGDGWKIALSTLMYERVVLTFSRQLQSESALRHLMQSCAPADRPKVARLVAKACAVRSLAYSHLLGYASGQSPGPEGSLDKLFWSESFQEIAEAALLSSGSRGLTDEHEAEMHRYLYSRGRTIAAGTSEIQRSIIAERLLGLPRLKFSR
jgi:alkylation response protein AidB-like acyl-CoA dehydrogenase